MRKKIKRKIRSSKKPESNQGEIQAFIEKLPQAALIIDKKGCIRHHNKHLSKFLNLGTVSGIGRSLLPYLDQKSQKMFLINLNRVFKKENINAYDVTFRIPDDNKSKLQNVLVQLSHVSLPKYNCLLITDITSLRRKTDELSIKTELLQQQSRELYENSDELKKVNKKLKTSSDALLSHQILQEATLYLSISLRQTLESPSIFKIMTEYLKEILGVRSAVILLKGKDEGVFDFKSEMGDGLERAQVVDKNIIIEVLKSRSSYVKEDKYQGDDDYWKFMEWEEYSENSNNLPRLIIPLVASSETVGAIMVFEFIDDTKSLSQGSFDLLSILAKEAGSAIVSTTIHEELFHSNLKLQKTESEVKKQAGELKRHFFELEVLYDLSNTMSYTLDFDQIINYIMKSLKKIINYDLCSLIMENNNNNNIHFTAKLAHPLNPIAIDKVKHLLTKILSRYIRKDINPNSVLENVEIENYKEDVENIDQDIMQSVFYVPLQYRGKIVGLLNISSLKKNAFSKEDLLLLNTMSAQTSIALDRIQHMFDVEKSKMEHLVEGMQDGMVMFDEKKEVVIANPRIYSIFRLNKHKKDETLISLQKVVDTLTFDPYKKLLEKNKEYINHDLRIYGVSYRATISVVRDDDENNIGLVVMIRDVSVEKQIEIMKSEFVSIVSHELRSPLSVLKSSVGVILEDICPPEKQKHVLGIIDKGIDRLKIVVDDLLDLSKLESGRIRMDIRPSHFKLCCESIDEMLQARAAQKKIGISFDIQEDLPELSIDKEKIERVLINLIDNAIKFSPYGSQIKVSAHKEDDQFVFITVKDSGMGIDLQNQESIFEKFKQVENPLIRNVGGTGLGLAIVKDIIKQHHGRIWVESEPEKGSTFSIALPIASILKAA